MKKRWFLTSLFALALCVCAASANAAVVSGGTEYVWYNGEEGLYISADQGGSYGVLPELENARKRTGLSYVISVLPNAANDGGLSMKGRDIWSTEYTWFRDYSAQEIAAALKNAAPIPVEVFATNGTVTVGSRYVMDEGNDDPTQPGTLGTNLLTGAYAGDRIVYSTDGVTWLPAEGEGKLNWLGSIWWDGEAFRSSDGGFSADGIHWTKTEEEQADPTFSLACTLGPYRFEYAENDAGEAGVYLMDHTSPDTGVLLPHMAEAAKANWVNIGKLRAWYGPNGTVILAAYDVYRRENMMVSIDYPISSLDWCLENLKTQFRHFSLRAEKWEGDKYISLAMVERGHERELLRCGDGWQWAAPPFHDVQRIYPYNGKTFVVRSDGKLYASEDGLSWKCLEGRGLGDEWDRREYSFVWAGDRYISCRRTVEYSAGRFGRWGKKYDPFCTQVCFLDEDFRVFASYNFDRQVEAVGYLDGVYYARVSDADGVSTNDYKATQGTLYCSVNGTDWTAMPSYYTVDRGKLLLDQRGSTEPLYHPTNDPDKPHRSIARLDRWRFVLDEYVAWDFEKNVKEDHPTYRVCLMGDSAADWVELPHLGEAIKAQGIEAWELSAAYNPDGTVEVKITDKSDANKYISISYPTSSLDWVKENLMVVAGRDLPAYLGTNNDGWDIESKYGVADLVVVELANGENELVYRTPDTGGHWHYFDSVPWGNEIALLEFSGKDFMVLDKADGKLYLSSDGVNWHEAAGEWYREQQKGHYRQVSGETGNGVGCYEARYAMKWTGDKYMAVCFWCPPTFAVATKVVWGIPSDPNMAKVLYLDEELNLIGSHDFGYMMTGVGYQDGRYFAHTDGHIYQGNFNLGGPERLFTSTDGKNWAESGLLSVQACLVKLQ